MLVASLAADEYVTSLFILRIARAGSTATTEVTLEGSNDLGQWEEDLVQKTGSVWPDYEEYANPTRVSLSGGWRYVRVRATVIDTNSNNAVVSAGLRTARGR